MASQTPKNTLMYFQPDQLAFFITHVDIEAGVADNLLNKQRTIDVQDGSVLSENKLREFIKESNSILQSIEKYKFTKLVSKSILIRSFHAVPAIDQCYKSKLYDERRRPKVTPRAASSVVVVKVTGLKKLKNNPVELLHLITILEERLLNNPLVDGLTLGAITPNWLVRGAPGQSGTGGPGGWPVAYRGSPHQAPYEINMLKVRKTMNWFEKLTFLIKRILYQIFGGTEPIDYTLQDIVKDSKKGEGVDIIILDTLPDQNDLNKAYRDWHDRHPLIHSLLKPSGPLQMHALSATMRNRIKDLRALGHDYPIPDHALFIAGLTHTIAPCAKIHLVEVLNPYGVGDTYSVLDGLSTATAIMNNNPEHSFVINCSLTLNLPLVPEHLYTITSDVGSCFDNLFTDLDRQLEQELLEKLRNDPNWLNRQRLSLQHACDGIYSEKSKVIAAAGNDRRYGMATAPQARYPAALESVQGIGALPKVPVLVKNSKRKLASYSNLADIPANIGIATLGGEAGEGSGLLGLYLGSFPGGEANNSKLAWWSGTSFAAPIVSALTAITLSNMISSATAAPGGGRSRQITQAAIDAMYNPQKLIQESEGESDVDVLDILQE